MDFVGKNIYSAKFQNSYNSFFKFPIFFLWNAFPKSIYKEGLWEGGW